MHCQPTPELINQGQLQIADFAVPTGSALEVNVHRPIRQIREKVKCSVDSSGTAHLAK
jgi:hypothetical protein